MARHPIARTVLQVASGVAACLALARAGVAQQPADPWDFRAAGMTRGALQTVLARYEAAARSSAYSAPLRAEAARRADSISARLRDGDMRPGDRVRLRVEGQAQLTDTFPIVAGPALQLPVVGTVALSGVLRSELLGRITLAVDSVYRGSRVTVELLTRLVVLGGVTRPGFYALPSGALLDDAISAAGGLTPDGRLSGVYIQRGRERAWEADSLQVAMRERRSVGDLGLVAGDRIVVPTALPSDPARTAQTLTYLLSLPLSLYTVLQLLK